MPQAEFWISDWIFRISSKIWSGWGYILLKCGWNINIAVVGAIGWIVNFGGWIWILLKNLVRMMYKSSWFVEVTFLWFFILLKHKFLIEYSKSPESFRMIYKTFYVGWFYWMRSHFPKMWLKHKYGHSRCHRLNFKFLIGYPESPENSDQDDI